MVIRTILILLEVNLCCLTIKKKRVRTVFFYYDANDMESVLNLGS